MTVTTQNVEIYRVPDLIRIMKLSRTTIWRRIKYDDFPEAIELGGNSIGWYVSDVDDWLLNRPKVGRPKI